MHSAIYLVIVEGQLLIFICMILISRSLILYSVLIFSSNLILSKFSWRDFDPESAPELSWSVAMVRKIAVITDSRGGFFQHFFNSSNDNPNVTFTTFVLKGRRIEELWIQTKARIFSDLFDHVYIWGGICNLTSPYFHNNTRTFWPLKHPDDLTYDLIHSIRVIVDEILHLGLRGRITFLPETGINLTTYNQIEWPQHWMVQCQHELNMNILFLHNEFKAANTKIGCTTPWTFDTVYGRNRHGMLYPKFAKLYDGLHPTPSTAADMVRKIMKDANDASI